MATPDFLGRSIMAVHLVLVQAVGVRIPAPQLKQMAINNDTK